MMPDKLKPCPFCGGEADVATGTDRLGYWWAKAYCRMCRAGIEDSYNPKRSWVAVDEGAREIAAAWNRRAETVRRHCEIYASRHEAYLAYKALKPVPHWFEDDGVRAFMVVDFYEWIWLPPANGNRYTHKEHDRFLDGRAMFRGEDMTALIREARAAIGSDDGHSASTP